MEEIKYRSFLFIFLATLFHLLFTILFTNVISDITYNEIMYSEDINLNNLQTELSLISKNINNECEIEEEFIPVITIDRVETDTVELPIEYRYEITDEEFNEFVRVVEAEVTGDHPFGVSYEDAFQSKLHVAQVILNRVESPYFPNTVHDVIFQKNAFTPLVDGRYWEVDISQVTIDACKYALLASTKDTTYGCEFFSSGTKECKYGSYVFTDKVGHSFFSYYKK